MSRDVRKTPGKIRTSVKDPVEVFCRLKPLVNGTRCIQVLDSKTIMLTHNSLANNRTTGGKEVRYVFKEVFDENYSQKDVFDNVGFPLVHGLIKGKNGLLFTYGVTGSGKTFTMNGDPENGGILPRALDVLFNSISTVQARKFLFKPDRMNGFEIQSDVEVMSDVQRELLQAQKVPKTPRKNPFDSNRVPDLGKVHGIDGECLYSVFVSHIEIYNNYIYDLLEDFSSERARPRLPQNKILREDSNHNMYVHGVNEVEVASTEEVFEVFYKGQNRKRMAHTCLNAESSRSHSVFTLRLIKAPLNGRGEEMLKEKDSVCVSQLSMVDLAGSERTNRTNNTGQRLREAGNINNSLLTLRTCFEILRENQTTGSSKVVPYRQSRLTHLFKNYFDGEGEVKMVVCLNPKVDDYEETVHVLRFADLSQEVQVTRPTPMKFDLGLTAGRKRAIINNMDDNANDQNDISPEIGLIYSLGPAFPTLELTSPDNADLIKNLMSFLEMQIGKRDTLKKELEIKEQHFRSRLVDIEKENILYKQEVASLKATLELEKSKNVTVDLKLSNLDSLCSSLEWTIKQKNEEISSLRKEWDSISTNLKQKVIEKEKEMQHIKQKYITEKHRSNKEVHKKQKELEAEFKTQIRMKDEKLRQVKEIISNDCKVFQGQSYAATSSESTSKPSSSEDGFQSDSTKHSTPSIPPVSWALPTDNATVSRSSTRKRNDGTVSHHRRSQSASNVKCQWLDHRPIVGAVALNTVLQPRMKRRKSITQLTDAKVIANPKTTKYCLTTQEADSGGEVETRLYKGDVVPTTGGGAQVVFNDVETLRQTSPSRIGSKRKSDEDLSQMALGDGNNCDTATKCKISIEGKRSRK